MEISIQEDIKDICECCLETIPNDILEVYIDYASLYYKKYWLILLAERLRRNELEISII